MLSRRLTPVLHTYLLRFLNNAEDPLHVHPRRSAPTPLVVPHKLSFSHNWAVIFLNTKQYVAEVYNLAWYDGIEWDPVESSGWASRPRVSPTRPQFNQERFVLMEQKYMYWQEYTDECNCVWWLDPVNPPHHQELNFFLINIFFHPIFTVFSYFQFFP